jgi:RNA polymerase sigma factor (sigma-70 family)
VLAALSDERLVERVRADDATAFEILYERHHRGVLSFCRHMLQSGDEAEDAVQHTFIAAYNDLQRRDGRELRFKAWLYTIARNRCLSILRARREQVADEIEISTDRLSDDVQHRADLRALLADLGELPHEQREALVLSEVGDFSHADVAAVLGCEVPKVKSLVFQARSALIERRQGREMSCTEIREQLATLRGGALRRSHLRHHLEACPGCRQYREEIRRQRQMLALALPVVPSFALKHQVLGAVGIGGGGAAVGGGFAGGLGLGAKTGLAKLGIAALVAVGGAGSVVVASHGQLPLVGGSGGAPKATEAAKTTSASALEASAGSTAAPIAAATATDQARVAAKARDYRSAAGTEHGFTPVRGESNGARAREFAKTRGNGRHTGLYQSHRSAGHYGASHRYSAGQVGTAHRATPAAPQTHVPTRVPSTPVHTPSHTAPTTPSTGRATTPATTTPAATPPVTSGGSAGHGASAGAPASSSAAPLH